MWWQLDRRINDAATNKIRDHQAYIKSVADENARRRRRSTVAPAELPTREPATWRMDDGFNPYHVRSRSHVIAHAISKRLGDRSYSPHPPAGFRVPKSSGGHRVVGTFQIADEVVSNYVFRSLMRKNLAKLSQWSYAYRSDRGAHDAIAHVGEEIHEASRLYIAEFDFSKFFDSVDHEYLRDSLDRLGIIRTAPEQLVIDRFLEAPEPYLERCASQQRAPRRRGIPQGTSISLFLANIAATEMDRGLERLGVGFARYADDTLIWSTDYGKISQAAAVLFDASKRLGAPINPEKSNGVRLLLDGAKDPAEIKSATAVDFLGHSISTKSVTIKQSSLERIKTRIHRLIYNNLLREPLQGTQSAVRLGRFDKDYYILILQLRRYLYGPLSENEIRRFQKGAIPPLSFEGVMSFFPLVDDDEVLLSLDSWMATEIWLALRKRASLLGSRGITLVPPMGLDRQELIDFRSASRSTGDAVDLRMPSFRRASTVIRQAITRYGLGVVDSKSDLYLYD